MGAELIRIINDLTTYRITDIGSIYRIRLSKLMRKRICYISTDANPKFKKLSIREFSEFLRKHHPGKRLDAVSRIALGLEEWILENYKIDPPMSRLEISRLFSNINDYGLLRLVDNSNGGMSKSMAICSGSKQELRINTQFIYFEMFEPLASSVSEYGISQFYLVKDFHDKYTTVKFEKLSDLKDVLQIVRPIKFITDLFIDPIDLNIYPIEYIYPRYMVYTAKTEIQIEEI